MRELFITQLGFLAMTKEKAETYCIPTITKASETVIKDGFIYSGAFYHSYNNDLLLLFYSRDDENQKVRMVRLGIHSVAEGITQQTSFEIGEPNEDSNIQEKIVIEYVRKHANKI